MCKAVVGHHRRNRREQADGGGHQGLCNAGGHGRQRDLLQRSQPREGVHDAPYRAKQAHIGRDRAHGGQKRQIGFNGVHFALVAGTHGPPRAVHQCAGVGDAAFAQFLIFTHAAGKNAFHRPRVLGIFGRACKQIIQAGAGPEFTVKRVIELLHLFKCDDFSENSRPACNGHTHQQSNHTLNDPTGMKDEADDGKVLVHGLIFKLSRTAAGMRCA